MQVKKRFLLILVALLLLTGVLATAFIMKIEAVDPTSIEGLLWPQQKPVSAFELIDYNGQTLARSDLKGQWSFLFFGYMGTGSV